MSQFKWGIIGTGGIARAFATDISLLGDHVVAAVGSRSLEKAEGFVKSIPGAKAYGSYEELMRNSEIDAIYVATPHPSHKENVIAALNAGSAAPKSSSSFTDISSRPLPEVEISASL